MATAEEWKLLDDRKLTEFLLAHTGEVIPRCEALLA
jgi:hypothetical protein